MSQLGSSSDLLDKWCNNECLKQPTNYMAIILIDFESPLLSPCPLKFPSPENIDSITSLMRLILCGMNKGFPYFHGSLWDFHGNGHIPQLMAVFMWFLGPFPAWCIQVSSAWRSACGERSYQVGVWYLKIVGKIIQIHWLMMIFLVKKRELHPMGEWFFSKKSVKTLTIYNGTLEGSGKAKWRELWQLWWQSLWPMLNEKKSRNFRSIMINPILFMGGKYEILLDYGAKWIALCQVFP